MVYIGLITRKTDYILAGLLVSCNVIHSTKKALKSKYDWYSSDKKTLILTNSYLSKDCIEY